MAAGIRGLVGLVLSSLLERLTLRRDIGLGVWRFTKGEFSVLLLHKYANHVALSRTLGW